MRKNRKTSAEWSTREGYDGTVADGLWRELELDQYPSGLDYAVLDCCLFYGSDVTFHWLAVALELGHIYHDSSSMARTVSAVRGSAKQLVESLDARRRRRVKLERNWYHKREALMNRIIRVRKRAMSLLAEEEEKEHENGDLATMQLPAG